MTAILELVIWEYPDNWTWVSWNWVSYQRSPTRFRKPKCIGGRT